MNKKLDGLENDFEHKWNNLQDSIENLIVQQQCPPEEECQSETMAEEQYQQQPHQGLIEDFIELFEGLYESSDMCDVVIPREKEEEIIALLIEEGSGIEVGKEPQKLTLQPIPMKLNPTATAFAQPQNSPLPVYILPTLAAKSKPAAPAPKAHASPSPLVQNFKRLVATVQAFANT